MPSRVFLELVRDAKRNFRGAVAAGIKSIGGIAAAVVDRIIMAPIDYHLDYVLSHLINLFHFGSADLFREF